MPRDEAPNKLFYGDNLDILRYFLEHAAEIFDQRVLEYLDLLVALDLVPPTAPDAIMARLNALRGSLRDVWQAIGEAEPMDIRLLDCGEGSQFSASMA